MDAQDWFLSVVSGRRNGVVASIARGVLSAAEPVYTAGVRARNFLYTRQIIKSARARCPVISVGNLTTGGTGKTPVVAWLTAQLRDAGRKPAVLLRGYRSDGGASDEELLLRDLIAPSPVQAQADRFAASERILAEHPEVDVFILDDGLQHRRLARDFSIVLVDATAPFGFDRVLPRGLLREPIGGLRRADAVVITRADMADAATLDTIEKRVRAQQRDVPVFRCDLKQDRLLDPAGTSQSIDALQGKRVFAFCGIGNPDAFFRQLAATGGKLVGKARFVDHHPYTPRDLSDVFATAKTADAEIVVTTEKDWVKVGPMIEQSPGHPPVLRVGISVVMRDDGGAQLIELAMVAFGTKAEGSRQKAE